MTYLAAEDSKILPNHYGVDGVLVALTQYQDGHKMHKLLTETNGHGNWIKWKTKI